MKKIVLVHLLLALLLATFAGCSGGQSGGLRTYKLGVTGSDFEIWEGVSSRLESQGIKLEIISFSDYTKPNLALSDGEIQLNAFQTEIFFNDFIKAHNLKLVNAGYTVVAPMGIYSSKIKSLSEATYPATVAIPNDVTNGGRALKYLETLGFLTLKPEAGLLPTVLDITGYDESRKLELVEMVATQIPRSLADVEFALINNGVAFEAGLTLSKDALEYEDPNLPHMTNYWNMIAVREEDADKADIKAIVEAYHSDVTRDHLNKKYGGQTIPVF